MAPTHAPAWIVPAGTLVATLAFVSRQPNALLHPALWAEEGQYYFANLYNLGIAHTVILPQAGYFQIYPILAAGVARLVPITAVPFVMAVFGLAAQIVPVPLLLSERSASVAADLRVRILLALVCLMVPMSIELDAHVVNAQWSLALAAFLVVVVAPPGRAAWRVFDVAILLISGLTGPFAIPLAVIAWIRRRLHRATVSAWTPVLLTACAVLQIFALLVLSHHDAHNPAVEPRPHAYLGATPRRFAQIAGGRLLLSMVIGPGAGQGAAPVVQWLALGVGLLLAVLAIRTRREVLILFLGMAGVVFAAALLDPAAGTHFLPSWFLLAAAPLGGERYFFMPAIALLAALMAIALGRGPVAVRAIAGGLLALAVVVDTVGHWRFPETPSLGFHARAVAFEHSPAGTRAEFPVAGGFGYAMVLVKH